MEKMKTTAHENTWGEWKRQSTNRQIITDGSNRAIECHMEHVVALYYTNDQIIDPFKYFYDQMYLDSLLVTFRKWSISSVQPHCELNVCRISPALNSPSRAALEPLPTARVTESATESRHKTRLAPSAAGRYTDGANHARKSAATNELAQLSGRRRSGGASGPLATSGPWLPPERSASITVGWTDGPGGRRASITSHWRCTAVASPCASLMSLWRPGRGRR